MKKRLYERDCKVNTNKKVNESEEIDRQAFGSLIRYGDKPYDGYAILNDGYFVKRIYAESDEDAKKQFQDWLDRGGTGAVENDIDEEYDNDDWEPTEEEIARYDMIARYSEKHPETCISLEDLKRKYGL